MKKSFPRRTHFWNNDKGHAKVMVGEEEYSLKAGQIVLIPPGLKTKYLTRAMKEWNFWLFR